MKLLKTLLATAVAVSAVPAMAYEAGDIMVKVGVVQVQPKSDPVSANKAIEIEEDTQLGVTATYMVTSKIGVELLAATPFEHDITANGKKIGSTKHLPPTVSAQYYFLDPASPVQVYAGLGVNHTFFFDEDGAANHLSKSTGLAYSLGVNYDVNEEWLVNAAVWKVDIDSELNGTTDVEIDPTVFFVSAGYKF